jgi:membrane protein YdbS with pleckstrin-like domain
MYDNYNNWYAIIIGTFFILLICIIIKTIIYDNYNNWYAIIGGMFFILLIGIIIKIIIVNGISLFPKTVS